MDAPGYQIISEDALRQPTQWFWFRDRDKMRAGPFKTRAEACQDALDDYATQYAVAGVPKK